MLRKLFNLRGIRFLLVGGLNTIFGFAVFSIIVCLGGQTWHALLGGNLMGIVFNFLTIGGVVFCDISLRRLPRFALTYLGLLSLNLILIGQLTSAFQLDRITTQALLTAPMAILSYLIVSKFVFSVRGN